MRNLREYSSTWCLKDSHDTGPWNAPKPGDLTLFYSIWSSHENILGFFIALKCSCAEVKACKSVHGETSLHLTHAEVHPQEVKTHYSSFYWESLPALRAEQASKAKRPRGSPQPAHTSEASVVFMNTNTKSNVVFIFENFNFQKIRNK